MFFKWSANTAIAQANIECSLWVVRYVLSVFIIDYNFKQQNLTSTMVVKFADCLHLHLKSEIIISLSRKVTFVKKQAGDKVQWNVMLAIS